MKKPPWCTRGGLFAVVAMYLQRLYIAAHQADIVKFTVGQARQGFARHALVVPSGDAGEQTGKQVGGAGAGRAGLAENGHGEVFPEFGIFGDVCLLLK